MGARKSIQIGNRSFPTQGDAIRYVSDRLNSYEPGSRVTQTIMRC